MSFDRTAGGTTSDRNFRLLETSVSALTSSGGGTCLSGVLR